jgi:hypothetical protein
MKTALAVSPEEDATMKKATQYPSEPESFLWEGDINSAPPWIDRGWAGYDGGPALHIPRGDPTGQPYTTRTARIGDIITYTPGPNGAFGGFAVVPASESGNQPGVEAQWDGDAKSTPTFRPPAQTEADLRDLVKTGATTPEEMDPDAQAQYYARHPTERPEDEYERETEETAPRTRRRKASDE